MIILGNFKIFLIEDQLNAEALELILNGIVHGEGVVPPSFILWQAVMKLFLNQIKLALNLTLLNTA